jgi:hypothetical protein
VDDMKHTMNQVVDSSVLFNAAAQLSKGIEIYTYSQTNVNEVEYMLNHYFIETHTGG